MLRCRLPYFMAMVDSKKTITIYTLPKILEALSDGNIDCKIYGNSLRGELPEGYTRLESLSSTGYEYINTGLVMQSGDEIELDYEWLGNTPSGLSSDMMFFGCQNIDTTRGGLWTELYKRESGLPTWYARFGGTSSNSTMASADHITGRHLLNINQQRLTIDDSQVIVLTASGNTFQTTPLTLFGRLSMTGAQLNSAKLKVYSFKVINNGVIRLNLIPCKNTTGVLGMYDTVTNTFLTNAGTGTFVAGAEVKPTPTAPIAIESVGDKTRNLFNKNTVLTGYRLNTVSAIGSLYGRAGDFVTDGAYCVSELMEVEAGAKYIKNTPADAYHRIHFYDANKICITVSNSSLIAAPADAKYIAVCMSTEEIDSVQVENGDTTTEYVPYGYQIPLTLKGKNLADINSVVAGEYVVARSSDAGFGNIKSNSAWARTDYIEIEPNTTYTIYFDDIVAASAAGLCIYDGNKNVLVGVSTHSLKTNTHDITMPENAKYLIMSISASGATVTNELAIYKQDGTYENIPYTSTTTTVYLDEPLRKIGDYVDYINSETHTVVRNIGVKVLDGTESWTKNTPTQNAYFTGISGAFVPATGVLAPLCSHYPEKPYQITDMGDFGIKMSTAGAEKVVLIKDETKTTSSDFTTYLAQQYNAGTPVTVIYPLATPTTETYTIDMPISATQGILIFDVGTVVKPSQVDLTGDIADGSM